MRFMPFAWCEALSVRRELLRKVLSTADEVQLAMRQSSCAESFMSVWLLSALWWGASVYAAGSGVRSEKTTGAIG